MTKQQKPTWARALLWPVSWLLDRNLDLSTSKIMAFAILVSNDMGKTIPPLTVGMLISCAFGYSAWKDWVAKGTWNASGTAVDSTNRTEMEQHIISESTTKTIEARRDPVQGFESTP